MIIINISKQNNNIFKDYDFEEDEDIILPNNIWDELIYIKFMFIDIIKNRKNLPLKITRLKRQINIYFKWSLNKPVVDLNYSIKNTRE